MDLISQLPESIVPRILYYCPPAELVRMSVASKTWFRLTASFPHLDFTIRNFRSRESFFKYVEYTTSRFCNQNLTAHRLRLITTLREPAELYTVDRCLELLLQNGVYDLVINVVNLSESPSASARYRLPNILLSVSALSALTINGCDLPSSFMLHAVMFKCLGLLCLINVSIDDEVISYLTTSCPFLRVFQVEACHGLKRFCVYGHQHLRSVSIQYNTPFERIDIEAPNLHHLLIKDDYGRGPPQMNLASCEKLKNVSYYENSLSNVYIFTDILSNFPFVENLNLSTSYKCNKLKLSSHSLRTLVLYSQCDLEKVEFNTPNLVSFCYSVMFIDTLWFQKLRQLFNKKNVFNVSKLYIRAIYSKEFRELEKLKAIKLPPYELELVELKLETQEESLAHIAFVDAVLWCCRPRSLTLRSCYPYTALGEHSDVVKVRDTYM
ncbi:F-box/FBD/LRR-repeat protein At1g78750 isoform X2 [Helianthus annuus]|uniref:F-box/FBD/LRR-repeat protein At1g78750 isoform X2 n=1 Tax=Helianthus annuus TaxID=4232 RepID=UPI00165317DA|nr:F-box/FBD/LRR-repeat protein At1g78750 isoform X2 [Helianthus annuus]